MSGTGLQQGLLEAAVTALPPDQAARATMMASEDISAAVMMAVALPRRAMVSELTITATEPRDMSADIAAALSKREA